MMKIIKVLLLFLANTLFAQSPVIDRYGPDRSLGSIENAYNKDVTNFRDPFVGTWVYINGNEVIRVRFKKIDMFYNNGPIRYYEDYLVGEIQYINPAGVEKINSIHILNQPTLESVYDYSLYSGAKISNTSFPQCLNCPEGTHRLYMFYSEPQIDDMGLRGAWAMRVVNELGVLKLKVQFYMKESAVGVHKNDFTMDSTHMEHYVPYGEYTFIKEN